MSTKLIAVQGMTVTIDPSTVATATIVVLPPTGTKVKVEGKLTHRDGDQITVSVITVPSAGATIPDPGPYTVPINKTVLKVKAEGIEVLVLDDVSDTINAIPKIPGSPPGSPPVDHPVSFSCKITDVNQTKVNVQ